MWNGGDAEIHNSILVPNGGVGVANRKNGTITTSYSVFVVPSDGFNNNENGNIAVPSSFAMGPLQDNGGPVPTHLPLPGSVVIENGQSDRFADQRNLPAQAQEGGGPRIHDIGAVELQEVVQSSWETQHTGLSQFGQGDAAVFGFGFDDGQPDADGDGRSDLSGVQKKPEFLGFQFNPDRFTVGGVAEGLIGDRWGGELTADVNGRFGPEYGFYANSGSVDVAHNGQFGFGVEEAADGSFNVVPSFDFTEGSLYTLSPRFGAYVDLIFELYAHLAAEAAVGFSVKGSETLRLNENVPLISVNRPSLVNGNMSLDGEINIAGSSAVSGLFDALKDSEDDINKATADEKRAQKELADAETPAERAAAQQKIDDARTRRQEAEQRQKAARDSQDENGKSFGAARSVIGFELGEADGSLLGLQGTLSVGLGGKSGGIGFDIGKDLGSLAVTIPDIAMSSTNATSRGSLVVSTDQFAPGSEQDLKRQLAKLNVDLGALTGIGGVTSVTLGPIGADVQTVSYYIQPTLNLSQTLSVTPYIKELQADFSTGSRVTVNGQVRTTNGGTVTFRPGDDLNVVPPSGSDSAVVTPRAVLGARMSNTIGLDAQMRGVFEALGFELFFAGESVLDVGPLFEHTHNFGGFDLGNIFDRTFDLPENTVSMAPFTLGAASSSPGIAPGNTLSLNSAKTIQPSQISGDGLVYTSATMLTAGEQLYRTLDLSIAGNQVNGVGVLEEGLVADRLDGSGNVMATIPLTPGILHNLTPSARLRVRPYSTDKLVESTEAMVALRFAVPSSNTTITATPLDPVFVGIDPPPSGTGDESINRDAVDASNAVYRENTGLDVDGDGDAGVATDGMLLLRWLSGVSGSDLIEGALSLNATRTTPEEIEHYILNGLMEDGYGYGLLDPDDNGIADPMTDGVLLMRFLAGMRGADLTDGALAADASRTDPAEIARFLESANDNITNSSVFQSLTQTAFRDAVEAGSPVDLNVIPGSTPWTALPAADGAFPTATLNARVQATRWWLKDHSNSVDRSAWQDVGVVVDGDSNRLGPLLDSELLQESTRADISARLTKESEVRRLGVDTPVYLHLPDSSAAELVVPAETPIREIVIPYDVRGNAWHSGFVDIYDPAADRWYPIKLDQPLQLPIPATRLLIYPRSLPSRSYDESARVLSQDLGLRIGVTFAPESTPQQILLNSIGHGTRDELFTLLPILVGADDSLVMTRSGATYRLTKNDLPLFADDGSLLTGITFKGQAGSNHIRWDAGELPFGIPITFDAGGDSPDTPADVVLIRGADQTVDLTGPYQLRGVEVLDLSAEGNHAVRLDLDALTANTGTDRLLRIKGNARDSVSLINPPTTAATDGWFADGTVSEDDVTYVVYRLRRTVAGVQRIEYARAYIESTVSVRRVEPDGFSPSPLSLTSLPDLNAADGPRQFLLPTVSATTAAPQQNLSFDINYRQDPGERTRPSLLTMHVHYDASQVSFSGMTGLLTDGLIGISDGPETVTDGDPRTDRMATIVWATPDGVWQSTDSEVGLGQANFVTSGDFRGTAVRLSAETGEGFTLVTQAVTIDMPRPYLNAPGPGQTTGTPEFSWRPLPGAERYQLFVENLSTGRETVIAQWTADTSFTPEAALPVGQYRAWTRAEQADGTRTPWAEKYFSVRTQTSLLSPASISEDAAPTFRWNAVPGAVSYELWVDNRTTGQSRVIHQTSLTGSSYTPEAALPAGRYRYWVRARAAQGLPTFWTPADETVVTAVPLSPRQASLDTRPEFRWAEVSGAEVSGAASYQLWVQQGQGVVINQSAITGTSFTSDVDLSDGRYLWWVRPFEAGGLPLSWSAGAEFDRLSRLAFDQTEAYTVSHRPVFSWPDVGADRYELWVDNLTTGQPRVIHETDLTDTEFIPSTSLTAGQHDAWVRPVRDDSGAGQWSKAFRREIGGRRAMEVLGPTGEAFSRQPEFRWPVVPGAREYDLWVDNRTTGATQILRTTVPNTSPGDVVRYLPDEPLDEFNYVWWVRAADDEGGFTVWSSESVFQVRGPSVVSPNGTITTRTPEFRWDPVADATAYDLWVDRTAPEYTSRALLIYGIEDVSYTAELPLDQGAFRFWVRARFANGTRSPWGQPGTFSHSEADNSGVTLLEPAGGTSAERPVFSWVSEPDVPAYELTVVISTANGQFEIASQRLIRGNEWQPEVPLAAGHHYRWWVRTVSVEGVRGEWSAPAGFFQTAETMPQSSEDAGVEFAFVSLTDEMPLHPTAGKSEDRAGKEDRCAKSVTRPEYQVPNVITGAGDEITGRQARHRILENSDAETDVEASLTDYVIGRVAVAGLESLTSEPQVTR